MIPKELEANITNKVVTPHLFPIMFSMSYEDIFTIIFVAVQVVKKEVIVRRAKTPPKQSLDGAPSTWIAWSGPPSRRIPACGTPRRYVCVNLFLGGAAVHRCDNWLVSDPASAAEVTHIYRNDSFRSP